MNGRSNGLIVLCTSLWLATASFAGNPPETIAAAGHVSEQPAAPVSTPADPELQRLLEQLSQLSELIGRETQPSQVCRRQLEQSEIMVQLAVRSKGEERDRWMHLAVDTLYSAAIQPSDSEAAAMQRLAQMPNEIARAFPGSPVASHAVLLEIQAEYNQKLNKSNENPSAAQERLCERLMRFAQDHPKSVEGPKAIMEAGQTYELLGKIDNARRCYHSLIEHYRGQPLARKAGGALSRIGLVGEHVKLQLPLLYTAGNESFDLEQMHGELVVVYFWSSAYPRAAEDVQALKQLSDRYRSRGLDVVQVNMDNDPAKARAFLSGRLTAGIHLHQPGGLDGTLAERYGIQVLPMTFLIGKEGTLIQHAAQPSQIETAIPGNLPHGR